MQTPRAHLLELEQTGAQPVVVLLGAPDLLLLRVLVGLEHLDGGPVLVFCLDVEGGCGVGVLNLAALWDQGRSLPHPSHRIPRPLTQEPQPPAQRVEAWGGRRRSGHGENR